MLPKLLQTMTTTLESVMTQALLLSDEERTELVDRLAASLPAEDELSDDVKSTLDRRWEEIASGKVECRDAFEVLAELRAKYNV